MKPTSTLQDRLLAACGNLSATAGFRVSQSDIARAAGVSRATVSNWFSGGHGISAAQARLVAKFLGVDPIWLETGDGEMLRLDGDIVQPIQVASASATSSDGVLIEQYHSTRGARGKGFRMAGQPGHISRMQVSDKWAEMNLPRGSSAENLKLVTGFGDMMKGTFNPGDPLLVDVSVNEFAGSGIYFFRIGDDAYMTRLQQVPGVGLRAMPDNKAYEPWSITQDMDFEIIGLLVKAWEGRSVMFS